MKRLFVLTVLGTSLVAGSPSAWAQSDDDLLDDIGGDEAPPADSSAADDDLDEIDDVDDLDGEDRRTKKMAKKEKKEEELDVRSLDRVKAIPKKRLLKRMRLELAPFFALSLNDPYYQHYATGASAVFYLQDAFGVGLGIEYFFPHQATDNLGVVRKGLTSVPAVFELPKMFAHLDFYWVPFYGKVSLFQTAIIHFDLFAVAGGGVATAFGREKLPAFNIGLGQRFVLDDWLALRWEVRDHLFIATQDVAVPETTLRQSDLQSYVLFYVGASLFIPPTFEYTYR